MLCPFRWKLLFAAVGHVNSLCDSEWEKWGSARKMNEEQLLFLCVHDATLEWNSTLLVLNICSCEAIFEWATETVWICAEEQSLWPLRSPYWDIMPQDLSTTKDATFGSRLQNIYSVWNALHLKVLDNIKSFIYPTNCKTRLL